MLFIEPYIKLKEKKVSRTTVAHLSTKDIDNLLILIPCENNKINYKEQFDFIQKKIIRNRRENQKLTQLRDWLLPMLMNGQVRIK